MSYSETLEVVDILRRHDTAAAVKLATPIGRDASLLPEALVLFATHNLSIDQQWQMAQIIFQPVLPLSSKDIVKLADCSARIGRFGFSFPQWRHIAQNYNETSLIEQFGMQRLHRDTDHFDPALPDPQRDRLGVGFSHIQEGWYIEYRRAYILCACSHKGHEGALVIRNNSDYYGRDRLSNAAYLTLHPMSVEELQGLDEATLSKSGVFEAWRDIPSDKYLSKRTKMIDRAANLLDTLDLFDSALAHWLGDNGIEDLSAFLRTRLAQGTKPPYLAAIDPSLPPWFPHLATEATARVVGEIDRLYPAMPVGPLAPLFRRTSTGEKLILLTGQDGDLPFRVSGGETPHVAQMPNPG